MNDPIQPPAPEPTPFGAGIPAEAVEPVRLPLGLAHGPARDVRGHAAAREAQAEPRPAPAPVPPLPEHARATVSQSAGQPVAAPTLAAASGAGPAPASAASAGSAPTRVEPSAQSVDPHASPFDPNRPPPATPPPSAPAAAAKPPRRWWIALAHLLFFVPFPFGVLSTAVLWIWRRARDPLMADQGREAINMQLTFWLAMGLLGVTCLASPLVAFVYVLGAVLCVLAAIAASGGDRHRYPWVFRFLT